MIFIFYGKYFIVGEWVVSDVMFDSSLVYGFVYVFLVGIVELVN